MIDVTQLKADFEQALSQIGKTQELLQLKKQYTGKKSPIGKALGNLRNVPAEDRRRVAQEINALKKEIEGRLDQAQEKLAEVELNAEDRMEV